MEDSQSLSNPSCVLSCSVGARWCHRKDIPQLRPSVSTPLLLEPIDIGADRLPKKLSILLKNLSSLVYPFKRGEKQELFYRTVQRYFIQKRRHVFVLSRVQYQIMFASFNASLIFINFRVFVHVHTNRLSSFSSSSWRAYFIQLSFFFLCQFSPIIFSIIVSTTRLKISIKL